MAATNSCLRLSAGSLHAAPVAGTRRSAPRGAVPRAAVAARVRTQRLQQRQAVGLGFNGAVLARHAERGPTRSVQVKVRCAEEAVPAPAVPNTVQEWVPKIVAFALPALISTLIGPVLSMIDTAYVGQVGVMDLAALAPGTLISDVTGYAFSWLGVGTIQIMSSAVAKGDEEEVKRVTRMSVLLGLTCGLLVAAWHTFGVIGLLDSVKTPSVLIDKASSYVTIRAMSMPVAMLNTAVWGICLSHRDTITPMVVSLLSAVLNLVVTCAAATVDGMRGSTQHIDALITGDYYFCVIMGQGVAGAAIATVIAQYASFLAYPISLFYRKKTYLNNLPGPLDLGILKKFIAFALPSMFVTTATLSVYGVMTWVANMSGVLVAAAGKVTVSIFQFFAFCGEPMFQTMTAMLPRENPSAQGSFVQAVMSVSASIGVGAGILGVLITTYGAGIFTTDPAVATECLKTLVPCFLSLLLIIPSRTLQGLCMAKGDFLYWAGMTAINAVLFAVACNYTTNILGAGYTGMWWVHVGLYVLTLTQFTWRAVVPAKPKAVTA